MGYSIRSRGRVGVWVLLFLVGLSTLGCSQPAKEEEKPTPKTIGELEQRLRAILQETNTPGIGVALVIKDEVSWVAGLGKADVAADKDVTTDTLFRFGSISKSFVSLAVLKLVEEGKLHLDDPLRSLAPELIFTNRWEETEPVRLAHVLEHTAGFDDIALCEYAARNPTISTYDALAFYPPSRTARWRPGTHHSYSNSGPVLAAYVVEKCSGKRFEDYVQEQLFDPLQMKSTGFLWTEAVGDKLAKSYERDGRKAIPYWHISQRPSGALNTTPAEMAHLVQMLLGRGKFNGVTLLQPQSIERMETPTTTLAGRQGVRAGYGLGNYTTSHKGFLFHGHDGGIEGFLSSYGYLPDHGVGYVYTINAANPSAFGKIGELIRSYLTRDLKKPDTPSAVDVSAAHLNALAGYYEPITPRQEKIRFLERLLGIVSVRADEDKLQARKLFQKPEEWLPVAPEQFRGKDDPVATVIFLPGDAGETVLQSYAGPTRGNYRAIAAWLVWTQWLLTVLCLALMLSSVLFALIWVPRWLFRRMKDVPSLSIRALPLVTILCLAGVIGVLALASLDTEALFARLGNLTIWSAAVWALTWLFALGAVAGLVQIIRVRKKPIRRWVYIHALLVSLANGIVLLYLAYWGLIGFRTWA
jgi:CubicO group peptidase (beta-lactamase class C family)